MVVIYLIVYELLVWIAKSEDFLMVGGHPMPVSAFAGVFSSLSNILMICLVVFFRKRGFVVSLILLILSFPSLLQGLFIAHSPNSLAGVFSFVLSVIAVIIINSRNRQIDDYQAGEIKLLIDRQKFSQHMFEQTATALVNAIDAKDTYSHGHSLRVAEYSRRIAEEMGKSEEECYRIYYSALLHDVGKIGIDDSIINKNGKLTKEEFDIIKQHPVMGYQILSSIDEYPYLSIGAHFHHERYDGKGYPDGLKGEDIPKSARIIAVADLYDEMTTYRQNRDPYPQIIVREELLKYSGTQLDPRFAAVMVAIMDEDRNYEMKQGDVSYDKKPEKEFECAEYRSHVSKGILIEETVTGISFECSENKTSDDDFSSPSIIVYDSYDGRVHDDPKMIEVFRFMEYCEAWFDGNYVSPEVRDMKV
jgi:hypothetical protein